MLEKEILEFGRRLGLGRLVPPVSGPLDLELAGLGRLSLEETPNGQVLLALALPLAPYEKGRLVRALGLCAPEAGRAYPLACGYHQDRLIFMVRLEAVGLSAADLENAARFLIASAKESEQS
jgi:type III secretion system chaperone SycN